LNPNPPTTVYIPRIYGFKIYKKKGSKYYEPHKNLNEITHYGEEQLKKLKTMFSGSNANAGGQKEEQEKTQTGTIQTSKNA